MSRGYTVWELVVATTLTMLVALGGLTALQVRTAAEQRAEALRQALAVVRRIDGELGRAPGDPCAVHRALSGGAPARCSTTAEGVVPGGIPYRLSVEPLPAAPGAGVARVNFSFKGAELLRHEVVVPVALIGAAQ